jgi:hypothetical protein
VGTLPSIVRHHLAIVTDEVELAALAFTVNDEETDPDGTDAHVTVGATCGTSTRGMFEFKVNEPELEE